MTHNRKGEAILIERKNGKISLKPFNQESKEPSRPRGFNPEGNALLGQSLRLWQKARCVHSLPAGLQMELTHTQTTDINWKRGLIITSVTTEDPDP